MGAVGLCRACYLGGRWKLLKAPWWSSAPCLPRGATGRWRWIMPYSTSRAPERCACQRPACTAITTRRWLGRRPLLSLTRWAAVTWMPLLLAPFRWLLLRRLPPRSAGRGRLAKSSFRNSGVRVITKPRQSRSGLSRPSRQKGRPRWMLRWRA